jgi:hypothetical protein
MSSVRNHQRQCDLRALLHRGMRLETDEVT